MKCIKLASGEIVRVEDEVAHEAVKQGVATYASKKHWRAEGKLLLDVKLHKQLIKSMEEDTNGNITSIG